MSKSKKQPRRSALRAGLAAGMTLFVGAALSAGCLDRPAVEQQPNTSNVFVDRIVNTKVDKIDLLFTIDNSVSMADKQQILKDAVPNLVLRLVNPSCVDRETGALSPYNGTACPEGSKREFDPIENIHIGVVTSSLGGHGGPTNVCATIQEPIVHVNDRGELLPKVRPGLPEHDPAGFLRWRGAAVDDEQAFIDDFTAHVTGAGETGCGFEAVMEGWYRFLIDPEPPVDMVLNGENQAVPSAINEALLAQRAAFLRPDSLVAIIMLSDENDCSIRDGGTDWLAARAGRAQDALWVASETCDTDPNSECCHSCQVDPPAGCPSAPRCARVDGRAPQLALIDDKPNIRCHAQKRRFGVDFLYSPRRYIDGLTKPMVPNRSGELVPNPLFAPGENGLVRDRSLVFLAGIVGVPWQDIATPESLEPGVPTLEFLTAEELAANGRWDVILGDPANNIPPTDPLMIESVDPRSGTNPITGDALVTWETPRGNPINGHEFNNPERDDLQYACTFPLAPSPLSAEECATKPAGACDCIEEADATMQKPLCFQGAGSAFSTTQYFAKAYPGTRYLEVLKGFGDNSIVASICPKNLVDPTEPTDPNAGYNPAVGAIVKRLGEALSGRCLPRELDVDEEGNVPCVVTEVLPGAGTCARAGRADPNPQVVEAIRKELKESETCRPDDPDCTQFTICQVLPLRDAGLQECLFDENATNSAQEPGYCYIDPGKGLPGTGAQGAGCDPDHPENCTNPLVETCDATRRRLLRFIGNTREPTPAPGSTTFVACVGSAVSQ